MDIIFDVDDDQTFRGITNLNASILALFKNSNLTDITLTFPGSDITFDAHRLILAMVSPVFEGILYGPMRTDSRHVELHDDDPLIIEYVIAHCYGANHLKITDMDTALEIYKLADKYMLEELKKECGKHIVRNINKDNIKNLIGFAESFNFIDLKSYCLPFLKKKFDDTAYLSGLAVPGYEKDESKYPIASVLLMHLKDDWFDVLLPEVIVKVLDFNESWKYPECPLIGSRLSTILASKCHLDKFYGCINAENVHQFPLEHTGRNSKTLELCISVMDPYHAKSVIEAINQQNRFEKHLIAIHIRCKEVWPSDWTSIPIERTHRPSVLLISDAGDDNIAWVIEAAKALLPHSEGSYAKNFRKYKFDDNRNSRHVKLLKTVNILKLPRCRFTTNGLSTMLQELIMVGVPLEKVIFQLPFIGNTTGSQEIVIPEVNVKMQFVSMDHDLFTKVFEDFPIMEFTFI